MLLVAVVKPGIVGDPVCMVHASEFGGHAGKGADCGSNNQGC